MGWYMEEELPPDEPEYFARLFLLVLTIAAILALMFGCSTSVVEPWECSCNCRDNTLQCKGITAESVLE